VPKTWSLRVYKLSLHGGRVCRYLPKGNSTFFIRYGGIEFQLTGKSRRGICVVARWDRGERLSRPHEPDLEWEFPSMAIKKRQVTKSDVAHLAVVETTLFAQHMALIEHMALRKYDDVSDRETGWVTIKTVGAAWAVQVKDPDSSSSFTAIGDTLDKAFDTANLLLACDEAPWEPDSWLAASKAKRKK